jgi:hypothetical protein
VNISSLSKFAFWNVSPYEASFHRKAESQLELVTSLLPLPPMSLLVAPVILTLSRMLALGHNRRQATPSGAGSVRLGYGDRGNDGDSWEVLSLDAVPGCLLMGISERGSWTPVTSEE